MISASDVKELREKTGAGMLDCKKALEENNGNMEQAIDWLREKGISKAAKKADRIAAEGLTNIVTAENKAVIVEINSETDFVAKNEEFKNFVNRISNLILNNEVTDMESALNITCEEGTLNDAVVAITAKIGERISFRRFEKIVKNDNQVFGAYLHLGGKISSLIVMDGLNEEVAKDVAMQAAAMRPKYVSISEVSQEEVEHEKQILKEQAINEGKPAEIAEKMVMGRISKYYQEVCLEEQSFVKNSDITIKQYVESNSSKITKMIRYEVGEGLEKRTDNFAEEVMNQVNNI
jgi:elongation factor Ts